MGVHILEVMEEADSGKMNGEEMDGEEMNGEEMEGEETENGSTLTLSMGQNKLSVNWLVSTVNYYRTAMV